IDTNKKEWQHKKHLIAETLSSKQQEVLPFLQMTNGEIGEKLNLSKSYVCSIVHNACKRLGLKNKTQLAVWALQHGTEYQLPPSPEVQDLPPHYRQAALTAHLTEKEAMQKTSMSQAQLRHYKQTLRSNLGISAAQLPLMAHAYH